MLGQYLSECSKKLFDYGTHDCLLFQANWVLKKRGIDPARQWRGTYFDKDGAEHLVREFGGIAEIAACGAESVPLEPTTTPQVEDIGIIRVKALGGQEGLAGGIKTGLGWALLGTTGVLVCGRASFVRAWRV